jgi:carbon-monoxide dehydrogenase medium subunit
MHGFDYARPDTLPEALSLAAEDRLYLAGGQSLIPTLKLRLSQPSMLIDVARLPELHGLRTEGGRLVVGAATTHAELAEAAGAIPALAALAAGIGDLQVRNMGTLGGSLAHNDPAGDLPAAVLGLGAEIRTDRRTIAADDFPIGLFETALEPGELIVSVSFPVPKRAGYAKVRNPASGYAIVGVFAAETDAGWRVAVTGAGECVFRLPEFEQALNQGRPLAGLSVPADGLNQDLHASAEYRAHLIGVLAARAAGC